MAPEKTGAMFICPCSAHFELAGYGTSASHCASICA